MDLLNQFKDFLLSQKDLPAKVTVKNYLSDVNHFIRWYEKEFNKSFSPKLITHQTIEQYKKTNSETFSQSSMDRHLSSLRKFSKFLKLGGFVSHDPFQLPASSFQSPASDPWHIKDFKNFLYVYNASHLTIKNYIIDIRQFFTWAENVTGTNDTWNIKDKDILNKIDNSLLEEYKNRLVDEGNFSPSTVNRKLSSLRKYLGWAESEGLIRQQAEISNFQFPISNQFNNSTIKQSIKNELENEPNELKIKNLELKIPNRDYSGFPPLRLVQKLSKAGIFAFDLFLTIPFAKAFDKVSYLAWLAKGKPVFAKLKTSSIKPKKINGKWSIVNGKSLLGVSNIPKEFYAPLDISTKYFPWYKKAWFTLRYKRPKWYTTYHSYPIAHYFNFAVLIIFMAVIGFGFYQSFFQKPTTGQPTLAAGIPNAPLHILSFQGRLTDNQDNPISTSSAMRFAIYNAQTPASGSALLWQEVDSVSPDQDGIFSILLGNVSPIPQWLFASNSALFLGVSVNTTPEMTPRQQLATVAFAANSELLQGLPPITQAAAGTSNVVLALDSSGNLTIGGSANPIFQASGGQFTISGQPLLLTTNTGSNGNIQLAPDGTGFIDITKPIVNTSKSNNIASAVGSVEIDDLLSVLATSSGQSAVTINQTGGGPLISASQSGTAKFTVDGSGNTTIAGGSVYSVGSTPGVSVSGQCVNSVGGIVSAGVACPAQTGTNWWNQLAGALSPVNTTNDFLLGSTATSSALFSFTGIKTGQTIASASGNFILMPNNGWGGQVGIGTINPTENFEVKGTALGQTLFGLRKSDGGLNFTVTDTGFINSIGGASFTNQASGTNPVLSLQNVNSITSNVLVVKGMSGQTGNLQQWQNSSGTPLTVIDSAGNVGIGTTSPTAPLHIAGAYGSNAAAIINQLNSGDIFTASASGTTRLTLSNGGNLNLIGGVYQSGGTNGVAVGSLSCVTATGGIVTGSGACPASGGTNWWNQLAGALSPVDTTNDLLIGSTATSSALFSFTGIKTGQTIASVSGSLIVMPNNGYGQIGLGTTTPAYPVSVFAIAPNVTSGRILDVDGSLTSTTNDQLGFKVSPAVSPTGSSSRTYIGGAFSLSGNSATRLTNATIRGFDAQSSFSGASGTLGTAVGGRYVIYNTGAAGIITNAYGILIDTPNNNTGTLTNTRGIYIATQTVGTQTNNPYAIYQEGSTDYNYFAGRVGIGTSTPLTTLDVRGGSGILAVASVSGKTTFAALLADNSGNSDIFTASSSGQTRFTINTNGFLTPGITNAQDIGTPTLQWRNIYANGLILPPTATIDGFWQRVLGALSPANIKDDLLLGSTATSTAQFSVSGIAKNQAVASLSGQLVIMPNNGWGGNVGIGTIAPVHPLDVVGQIRSSDYAYLGGTDTTGLRIKGTDATNTIWQAQGALSIDTNGTNLNLGYGNGVYALTILGTNGNVGIGTTTPNSLLDVNGAPAGKALANFNYTGTDQNILTASSSGTTQFYLTNAGSIYTRSFYDLDNPLYFLDPAATATSEAVFGRVGIGTTTPNNMLDVVGNIVATGYFAGETSAVNTVIRATGTTAGDGNNGSIYFANNSGATKARVDTTSGSTVTAGTGADGTVSVSGTQNINTATLISGRSCADGGDAVNYSASSLTSTTAVLSTTPSAGCLAAGDEVMLINLQGTSSNNINVGNYETLTIQSVSTNTVTFTTAKTKFYGDGAANDTNIGTATTNQRVMFQRIPNYSNLTVLPGGTLTASAWNGTKGGVLFFRVSGTLDNRGTITMNGSGFRGGAASAAGNTAGTGGESYDGLGAAGSSGAAAGNRGGGQGGAGTATVSVGGGAGGGGGYGIGGAGGAGGGNSTAGDGGISSTTCTAGTTATSATGGAGGNGCSTGAGGGGGGANTGTGGAAGTGFTSGVGGTTSSGAGGGAGGGLSGRTDLSIMLLGSAGGGGGSPWTTGTPTAGGNGGGIIYINANIVNSSVGTVSNNGVSAGATTSYSGAGGGGSGGSVYLNAGTATINSTLFTATGGNGGGHSATYGGGGGQGGAGRIHFTVGTIIGSSNPTADTTASSSTSSYGVVYTGQLAAGITGGAVNTLDVYGGAAIGSYGGKNTAPTNGLIVSGNVGIGMSSPNTALAVNGGNNINPQFPDGMVGTPVTVALTTTSTYTVPAGKTLYIINASNTDTSSNTLILNTFNIQSVAATNGNVNFGSPLPIASGTVISSSTTVANAFKINGFLVNTGVTPVFQRIDNTNTYTVPASKYLFLVNAYNNDNVSASVRINALAQSTMPSGGSFSFTPPIIAGPGNIIDSSDTTANVIRIIGYLTKSDSSGGADLAEKYFILGGGEPGDVISVDPLSTKNFPAVSKSTGRYDKKLMGIIATQPGIVLSDQATNNATSGAALAIGMKGRVPAKVSDENGPILPGDYLTSSSIPGVAMKATEPGEVVGKALDAFDSSLCTVDGADAKNVNLEGEFGGTGKTVCQGKVLTFINIAYYDPNPPIIATLDNMRNYVINTATNSAGMIAYSITDGLGNTVSRVEILAGLAVGNFQAGVANIQELTTNRIISPIAQIDVIHTNLISPIGSDSKIALKFENDKLSILNGTSASTSAVSSFDNQGNATFSGSLAANEASISGTLRAGKIIASEIEGLAPSVTNITNIYNSTPSATSNPPTGEAGQQLANSFPTLNATASSTIPYTLNANNYIDISSYSGLLANVGNLNAQTASFSQGLMVFGSTSLSDTSVVGQLSIDGNLILASNSINVLGGDLQLQPLKQGGLSIMAGLFYIDTNGNIKVGGNAEFAKDVKVGGILSTNIISPIPGSDLTLRLGNQESGITNHDSQFIIHNSSNSAVLNINQSGDLLASGTATFNKLNLSLIQPAFALSNTEVVATGSAGTASIRAYQTQITIDNPLVTDKSLIYVTPKSNQVIYLMRQVPGVSFTVGVSTPTYVDIPFNWIIVN